MLCEYIKGYSSLSIIGMCKNAGKTTVLNRLIGELSHTGTRLALTSIGRDGESVDLVTNTHKPGIYIYEDTLIATGEFMLRHCDITREIIETTGVNTPVGEVVILRARSDGSVQLAGPSITTQLAELRESFFRLGAELVIIDGAISRKTLCAPNVAEAAVLCTGASYSRDINTVVSDTAFATKLLLLPKQNAFTDAETATEARVLFKHEDGRVAKKPDDLTLGDALREKENRDVVGILFTGAVTDAMLKPVLMSNVSLAGVTLVSIDGSKLLFTSDTYDKLMLRGASVAVLNATSVAAVTVNPVSAYGFDFDANELLYKMRESVSVPVIDVGASAD